MKQCLKCGVTFDGESWRCPECNWQPQVIDRIIAFAPELAATDDMYRSSNFNLLFTLESGNFWFEARNRIILWALNKFAPQTDSFLEIGCGTGFVLQSLAQNFPDMALAASDLFIEGLTFAKQRVPRCEFYQLDARQLPFREHFAVIGLFDVIEHIGEDSAVLADVYKTVRPGGIVMLTVPQHPFLWSAHDEQARHQRRYQRDELEQKAMNAGFEIVHTTSFVSLLLPLMILSRLRHRQSAQSHQEFNISDRLNTWLLRVMGLELTLIKTGISIPVGGSRLVVLRRVDEG
ncbi:MAG: methyltransferase domain-containing protein [Chloroflexi bacterium]|nr:methyltransferase domain-containing protein [Chloroflexota bacterium]